MIFLLDATFPPKLARALQELTERRDCEFRYANDEFGAGAQDEVLIDGARERRWFLMTLDERITRNPAKRQALLEGGIGTFVFTGSSLARRSFYKIVAFVMEVAEEILLHADRTPRPFIVGISDRGKFNRLDI
ncbi:MAG: hypothetical protein ACREGL_07860 [Alphaproteobacteria bacterium]